MEDTGGVPTRLLAKGAKGVGIEIKKLASVTQGGASKSTIVDVLDSVLGIRSDSIQVECQVS